MKNRILFFIILTLLSGCTGRNREEINGSKEKRIRKKALYIAETYIRKQLKENQTVIERNGAINLSDDQKIFVIDPARIYVGYINDDQEPDVIVSIDRYTGQYQVMSEHLFILNSGGKNEVTTSFESDMRILELKDRIITAEVPTHSRNSPLFHCPTCREVKKFRFVNGELVIIE